MATHTFGELLKKYRQWQGLTQKGLADLIGRGRTTVIHWEKGKGKNPPDRDTVVLIGERLGLQTTDTNELLKSAGYAPIPLEDDLKDPAPPQLDADERGLDHLTVTQSDLVKPKDSPIHKFSIEEWIHPIPGFKPIPYGSTIAHKITHPNIPIPFKQPLFNLGGVSIPFELKLKEDDHLLMGVEHSPKAPTDIERSIEITPGAKNAIAAYVLVTAGNAYRIVDNFEFDGRRIGYLEFYLENGDPYRVPLILGQNIRNGSFKHPKAVGLVSDPNIKQVWSDPTDDVTIDLLYIPFPNSPYNVKYCQVCAQIEGAPGRYKRGMYPSIRLSGLTYQTAK